MASRVRSVYRSLLRELPPRPILSSPRTPIHQRIRNSISASTAAEPEAQAAQAKAEQTTALLEQMAAYLQAQKTYGMLLERYNPGMNMDEEERVRLTARKVGMDLPVEYVK